MELALTMFKKISFATLVLLFFAAVLHADDKNIVDEIIARVGNSIITRSDFERGKQLSQEDLKQRYPSDWQSKWSAREKDVLRDLIDQQLLIEKAKDVGITGETETIKRLDEMRKQMGLASMEDLEKAAQQQGVSFEDFKEQIRNNIITQQVIGREVGSRLHITSDEIQAWYQAHQKELASDEEVRLSEILISTQPAKPAEDKNKEQDKNAKPPAQLPEDPARVAQAQEKATSVLNLLRKGGMKFEDAAKKLSDGPTAAEGGGIGAFKRGELAKELEDKTFGLKPGEFTDVIRTKQGFLILKVQEHRQAGIPPIKDVEDKIRESIYVQKLEPAARGYLTKLRDEAYIDVRPGFLDTGASPNQNKPLIMAANAGAPEPGKSAKTRKKKKFLVF